MTPDLLWETVDRIHPDARALWDEDVADDTELLRWADKAEFSAAVWVPPLDETWPQYGVMWWGRGKPIPCAQRWIFCFRPPMARIGWVQTVISIDHEMSYP